MKTSEIIVRFIDIAQKYDWSKHVEELSDDEVETLFAAVFVAGFKPVAVRLGFAFGNLRNRMGETQALSSFQINTFAPYRVVCEDSRGSNLATKWLDNALRFAAGETDRDVCIGVIRGEVEKEIKLKDFCEC